MKSFENHTFKYILCLDCQINHSDNKLFIREKNSKQDLIKDIILCTKCYESFSFAMQGEENVWYNFIRNLPFYNSRFNYVLQVLCKLFNYPEDLVRLTPPFHQPLLSSDKQSKQNSTLSTPASTTDSEPDSDSTQEESTGIITKYEIYNCRYCEYEFLDRTKRKYHEAEHHGEVPIDDEDKIFCQNCNKEFIYYHLYEIHKNERLCFDENDLKNKKRKEKKRKSVVSGEVKNDLENFGNVKNQKIDKKVMVMPPKINLPNLPNPFKKDSKSQKISPKSKNSTDDIFSSKSSKILLKG